ncbi:hypothetical protein RHSIM_Rhsim02G0112700 [Rhododendron simsii]|uniref:non-specific serine/threonine protein kinase n=1 Tax=Rhododendron simsii TaxID=118357 RepID=A0A834HA98_RHOSS|nr:hypothetical protein RHSIM_Rhsim02G0112700 [Rhododendron simsii]
MGISNLFLLLSCILITLPLATAQPCPYPANFTANSTYGQNRNRILSSLATNAIANRGFYTDTFAQGSDTIYALALCRGDLSYQSCYECVDTASQSIIANCPNKMEAFDFGASSHCIVQCSNQSFFSTMADWPARLVWITSDITANVDEFDQALSILVDSLVNKVTTGYSVGTFATGEIAYTELEYIYGLVQCVPRLSSADCSSCISSALYYYRNEDCCFRKRAVNVITPSCIFQYDLSNFYESYTGAAPRPPSPPITVGVAPRRRPSPPVTLSLSPPSTNVTEKKGIFIFSLKFSAEMPLVLEQGYVSDNKSWKTQTTILIAVPVLSISVLLTALACAIFRRRKRDDVNSSLTDILPSKGDGNTGLPFFNVVTIAEATSNFSLSNKIGEGGFGPVFKGQLSTGQLIAVKRNSKKSDQGLREFKNEVILIAKLQHRNLVRLLGCCIEEEERMLIYEYMPNGSLNSFIFGLTSISIILIAQLKLFNFPDLLNWYLHMFDLLDVLNCSSCSGYMSPEYVMDGLFSMKSDVYSFGVLVLEIVSGKRNREFYHHDHGLTLLGHVWKLWIEGKALELLNEQIDDFPIPEALKCIQVGLLCVQQHPEDRPTMSSVLLALDSESATLPQPKEPGFYTQRSSNETAPPSSRNQITTSNEMTLTVLSGR